MKIAFVGLGRMGAPMARNLLKVGHSLVVFDVVEDRVAALTAAGATSAVSAKQAAAQAEMQIVGRGRARQAGWELAKRASTLSPRALALSKGLIHQARQGTPRAAALALERERFVDLFDGADPREGVNAFLEKRAPVWKNG